MAVHPRIIPGWPGYLGIPGYLDKGGAYGWPSWDNPGMARLLGNLWIFGQGGGGGAYGCPSWDNPGMARLFGNPGIIGQGGAGHTAVLPGLTPGWPGYLGIPGYLDNGEYMTVHPGIIPG